eukprot:gnl/MRDRNA2_/MRDRNA2_28607_c0_seq1.p1 gnl/MRDRNA2_/MRDRNA2_28607_c0~~gnl/MRDRNA2_/MRDRNA2_28607_c0_seq1.p1  ORF type:complete len:478 (+),score=100.65 gnl/MRDRNA2_/MRDRNA2_28607_c0_seq1:78-1511(+)
MTTSQLAAWRSPHDRVSHKELLAHYAQPLQELSQQLKHAFASHPKADPQVMDEIFMLRYLLSRNGDVAASAASIRQALDWRKQNLPLIQAATDLTKPPTLSQENLQRLNCYMAAGIHTPTSYGDLTLIIRAACCNFPELLTDLDSMAVYMMYMWEVCYQYCDSESRKRGYFVKLFIVNDMNGFSPNPFVMKKFGAVMGSQSKRSEFLYPQFLGMMCAANAPSILDFVFKMISPMMSKGFVDKFHIHGSVKPDPSRIAAKDLPLPFKDDDAAAMPSFIGGRCECEGGCVGINCSNVLPPPPKKTPDDLSKVSWLTTLAQVRYLQRQREEATKEGAPSTSPLCQSIAVSPVDTKLVESAAHGCMSVEHPTLLVSGTARLPSYRAELRQGEPKQNDSTDSILAAPVKQSEVCIQTEAGRPEFVSQPSKPQPHVGSRSSRISPVEEGEIQIQTEADVPVCGKGFIDEMMYGCYVQLMKLRS